MRNDKFDGFTLVEILVSLLIFTIISMMLMAALQGIISAQSGTEKHAERLRQLQMAMLMLARDIPAAINRPVLNVNGREESAFIGTAHGLTFTHTGFASSPGELNHSSLQRVSYDVSEHELQKKSWPVLDAAPQSQPHQRLLLSNVLSVHFRYLDKAKHFHDQWPLATESKQPLPVAVSVSFVIAKWGEIHQLYVISA